MDHRDLLDDYIKDECGVLAMYIPDERVANTAFFGLFALQHRGQESAGIAVSNGETVHMEKGAGLVNTVFNQDVALDGATFIVHIQRTTSS